MAAHNYTVNPDLLKLTNLPGYMAGTWKVYSNKNGWVRLTRVSGRGQKFASLEIASFNEAVDSGLFRPVPAA